MADAHRDQRSADGAEEREGASGAISRRIASRARAACRGALRGRRAESRAGISEHGDSRDDQRESGRAFTAVAHGVCPARSARLFDGRSGEKTWCYRKYAEGALVACSASDGRAAGTAPSADEGRDGRRGGRARVQLLVKKSA